MATNGALSAKQSSLLAGLLQGQRTTEAARSAKISERTAWRWQKEERFQAELEAAQSRAFDEKLKTLRTGVSSALATLLRNMKEDAPPNVQVSAARAWLEFAIQTYKLEELQTKVLELERVLSPGWRSL